MSAEHEAKWEAFRAATLELLRAYELDTSLIREVLAVTDRFYDEQEAEQEAGREGRV